jgi:hypothetical protein
VDDDVDESQGEEKERRRKLAMNQSLMDPDE